MRRKDTLRNFSRVALIALLLLAACSKEAVPTEPAADDSDATEPEARYSVEPGEGTYSVGQTFSVDLVLSPTGDTVNATDIVLVYDPEMLQVVDANDAVKGVQVATTTAFDQYPLNEALDGELRIGAASLSGGVEKITTVATVTFTVKASGIATLKWEYAPDSTSDTDAFGLLSKADILTEADGASFTLTQ